MNYSYLNQNSLTKSSSDIQNYLHNKVWGLAHFGMLPHPFLCYVFILVGSISGVACFLLFKNKKSELFLRCIFGCTKKLFYDDIKSWPLYFTPNILPSTNKKVFYIGDAFNGFLPTMAQGAGQSIESAHEIFTLLQKNKLDKNNPYFEVRSKRAKIIRKRSNFNFFAFHFSSSIMQKIRNIFLKFLVKRKTFIRGYLGKVYKN